MTGMTIQERIESSLARSKATVYLRGDFDKFGSYDQVGRALRAIVAKGLLVKAGYGIYAKARKSSLTGNPVPVATLMEVGLSVLSKLGVNAQMGTAAQAYSDSRSTQVPMRDVVKVGRSRVTRKIGFGGKVVRYER
jgi:hypothetical protein